MAYDKLMGMKGWGSLAVIDADGHQKSYTEFTNTAVNTGKAQTIGLAVGISSSAFDYVAIGTDSTAPNVTDSALGAELYRSASTASSVTTTVTDDTAQFSGSFAITGSATITEIGIFNSSSGGVMLARATDSQVVSNGDTLNYQYNVQQT
jgi:hypothetical protein